jgi:sulfotransferase
MKSFEKFIALSGLPRSGSTLLSSILSQNPDIHAEGNSAVCQLMWDNQQSCRIACSEQLGATNRLNTEHDIVSNIPHIYYKDIISKVVFDKCRSWTIPENLELLNKSFDYRPKVVVLLRPMVEIVKSFILLCNENNRKVSERSLLENLSEPIMRSFQGVRWAKEQKDNQFIFIQYDELVNNTKSIIDSIYNFCDIEPFNHHFDVITNKFPEDDKFYGLIGQHDIRQVISKRTYDIQLSNETIKECKYLDSLLN